MPYAHILFFSNKRSFGLAYNRPLCELSQCRLTIELKAPTSPATLSKDDSLTYLNQDQPYIIKLIDGYGVENTRIRVNTNYTLLVKWYTTLIYKNSVPENQINGTCHLLKRFFYVNTYLLLFVGMS